MVIAKKLYGFGPFQSAHVRFTAFALCKLCHAFEGKLNKLTPSPFLLAQLQNEQRHTMANKEVELGKAMASKLPLQDTLPIRC